MQKKKSAAPPEKKVRKFVFQARERERGGGYGAILSFNMYAVGRPLDKG